MVRVAENYESGLGSIPGQVYEFFVIFLLDLSN